MVIYLGYPREFKSQNLCHWFTKAVRKHCDCSDLSLSDPRYFKLDPNTFAINHRIRPYFVVESADTLIDQEKNFIIPIVFYRPFDIEKWGTTEEGKFPERVQNYIKAGKAKVVFYMLVEGYLADEHIRSIELFMDNNELPDGSVWVACAGRGAFERYTGHRVKFRYTNLFLLSPWHVDVVGQSGEEQAYSYYISSKILNFRKPYRFLHLARQPRAHRLFLHGLISSIPSLRKQTLYSCGAGTGPNNTNFYGDPGNNLTGKRAKEVISSYFPESRYRAWIEQYYEGKESCIKTLDTDPYECMGGRENPVGISNTLYTNTSINLLGETFFQITNQGEESFVFLSEKTMKPLTCCQPFIMVADCGTLQLVKDLGFQTFDKWWDESYDQEENPDKRMDMICDLILNLSDMSDEAFNNMMIDMGPTLLFNSMLSVNQNLVYKEIEFYYKLVNNELEL